MRIYQVDNEVNPINNAIPGWQKGLLMSWGVVEESTTHPEQTLLELEFMTEMGYFLKGYFIADVHYDFMYSNFIQAMLGNVNTSYELNDFICCECGMYIEHCLHHNIPSVTLYGICGVDEIPKEGRWHWAVGYAEELRFATNSDGEYHYVRKVMSTKERTMNDAKL